jgi:tetratricopeptide (TPR) repeat protein
MSYSSVMRYQGPQVDAQKAGQALNVQAVLTGQVVQEGENLSTSAELVNVRNGTHLWGEQFNDKLGDLLSLQQTLAKDISGGLRLKLSGAEEKQITKTYTDDPEAYRLYLQGRYATAQANQQGVAEGLQDFQRAIARDPNYALAYAGIAYNYVIAADWTEATEDVMPKAVEAARKAIAIDPNLAEAHTWLGVADATYFIDWSATEKEFEQAVELDDKSVAAHEYYAMFYLLPMERFSQAIEEETRAVELDPFSPEARTFLGTMYRCAGQNAKSKAAFQKAVELDLNYWVALAWMAWNSDAQGNYVRAIQESEAALKVAPNMGDPMSSLGYSYAMQGNRAQARQILEQLEARSESTHISPYFVARVLAGLGESRQAVAWLEKGYQYRSIYMSEMNTDPAFAKLHSDPSFQQLVRQMGLPLQ